MTEFAKEDGAPLDELGIAEAKKVSEAPKREDLEAVRLAGSTRGGEVRTNRLLARLRHLFSWAIKNGYTERTPFKRAGEVVIQLESSVEQPRSRRLNADEEARLLQHAGRHLWALIIAALETGMRRGELLSLRWADLRWTENVVHLPAERTKARKVREIPITSRLKSVLEMRRHDPAGKELPATAFVFGDEVGDQVKSIKTAWRLTCKRAGIDGLRFHDLRRECASRLLETPDVSLTGVRDWLGHSDVSVTNAYLASTKVRLQRTAQKLEAARAGLSQGLPQQPPARARKAPAQTPTNSVH